MLGKTLCVGAGLAMCVSAMANPIGDAKPVRHLNVALGANGSPAECRMVYNATDFDQRYFWTPFADCGAGIEWGLWADDLHLDCNDVGLWCGGSFHYQPNGTGGENDFFTIAMYTWENDDANSEALWPNSPDAIPLYEVVFEDMPMDSAFSWTITFTLLEPFPEIPPHMWMSLDFFLDYELEIRPTWDPGPGIILKDPPAPDPGRGDDLFFIDNCGAPGLYWFGGDPQAVFGFAVEADCGGGAACLGLDVSQLIAGSPGTFTVEGEPGQTVGILYSLSEGTYTIADPGRLGWCIDLGLKLPADPRKQIVAQGTVGGTGVFTATVPIPAPARGLTIYFQAAAKDTCPDYCSSDVVSRVVGP